MILVSTKDLNNVTIVLPVLNNAGLTESKVSALPKSVKNIHKILLQLLTFNDQIIFSTKYYLLYLIDFVQNKKISLLRY